MKYNEKAIESMKFLSSIILIEKIYISNKKYKSGKTNIVGDIYLAL